MTLAAPILRGVEDPLADSGTASDVSWAGFVRGPLPSGGDDAAAIQAYIDVYAPQGIATVLADAIYLVNTELSIPATAHGCVLRGIPGKYDIAQGTRIKANAAIRSCITTTSCYKVELYGITFNANRLANYAAYFNGWSWGVAESCNFLNGILDGAHLGPAPRLNGVNRWVDCFFSDCGVTYATAGAIASYLYGTRTQITGTVATTAASTTLTFTGAPDLTTLGIRAGELIRIHSSPIHLAQIASVAATTITLMTNADNRPSLTGSGLDFAIGVGAGFFEEDNGDNNVNTFWQCVARFCPVGKRFDGLYGPQETGGQADFNSFVGNSLSRADNASAYYGTLFSRHYTEANTAGQYFVGEASDMVIAAPNTDATPLFAGNVRVADVSIIRDGQVESSKFGPRNDFVIQLTKTGGGVMQHRFISDLQTASGSAIAPSVTAPSAAYVNTPALDSVTAFVGGAGLASDVLVLDTANQGAVPDVHVSIEGNSTGETVTVSASVSTINVNGTTIVRTTLRLYNTSMTQVGWGATIGTSESLAVRVSGRIRR